MPFRVFSSTLRDVPCLFREPSYWVTLVLFCLHSFPFFLPLCSYLDQVVVPGLLFCPHPSVSSPQILFPLLLRPEVPARDEMSLSRRVIAALGILLSVSGEAATL